MAARAQNLAEEAVLVFPGGMDRSLDYAHQATGSRRRVVGASSLAYDPARANYADWVRLPLVTEPAFEGALRDAVEGKKIGEIFTPHPMIGDYLERRLAEIAPGVRLVHESLLDVPETYRRLTRAVDALTDGPWDVAGPPPRTEELGRIERYALFNHARTLPGQCDNEKIWAICEVLRRCPPGDLVEIGSLWGKSAFVLTWLARRFAIGPVLCIDPWSAETRHQHDEGGKVNAFADRMDFDAAFEIFQINLADFDGRWINFLRSTSQEAVAVYTEKHDVRSETFGRTRYAGQIAFLHIDGNHDHASVADDIALWAPLVMPGGWIMLDDYRWAFGHGPKLAGENLLSVYAGRIGAAFVADSALFLWLEG
ncbi:MAG: class I SAM-dependent methyltransferase [Alphaproteobacteria bacterium]